MFALLAHGATAAQAEADVQAAFARIAAANPDEYERVTDVCYHGTVHGTRSALSRMLPLDGVKPGRANSSAMTMQTSSTDVTQGPAALRPQGPPSQARRGGVAISDRL